MHTLAPHFQHPTRPEGPSSLNMWEEMPFSSRRRGSGRRKVIWALCFLLLLLEAGSAKNLWKRALHTRLAEKSRVSAWGREAGRGWETPGCCLFGRWSLHTRAGQRLDQSMPGLGVCGGEELTALSRLLVWKQRSRGHAGSVRGGSGHAFADQSGVLLTAPL